MGKVAKFGHIVLLVWLATNFCIGQTKNRAELLSIHSGQGPSMVAPVYFKYHQPSGWMLRVEPTFFYRTISLQAEKMFSPHVSFGANFHYKIGSNQSRVYNGRTIVDHSNKNGYLIELATKYYFGSEAPSGWFLQCHVGFGDLLYEDGTWRPGGINTSFASKVANERNAIPVPGFFRSGIAVGYQQVLVDQYLTINVMGGLQVQNDTEGYKGLWFFAPSFGIYF